MTLMLWLHGNEFSPEGASYKLQRQQAKIIYGISET